MIVRLRNRVADLVTAQTDLVLLYNLLAGQRIKFFHPIEQGGPDIETDLLEISQFGIWAIALRVDPFIPI